jgi:hypothetical protein
MRINVVIQWVGLSVLSGWTVMPQTYPAIILYLVTD